MEQSVSISMPDMQESSRVLYENPPPHSAEEYAPVLIKQLEKRPTRLLNQRHMRNEFAGNFVKKQSIFVAPIELPSANLSMTARDFLPHFSRDSAFTANTMLNPRRRRSISTSP